MKPSEAIRKTKEFLMEKGWTQEEFECIEEMDEETGEALRVSYCIAGAYSKLTHGHASYFERKKADETLRFIARACPVIGMGADMDTIFKFNDHEITTFSDIVDVLDKAEKLALIDEETAQ